VNRPENESCINIISWILRAIAVVVVCLVVGCAGSGSQGGQQDHAAAHPHSANVTVELHPEGDSAVSGSAYFEDTSAGVVVKLDLRGLPEPETLYLSHIHPGTCADEAEAQEHSGAHGEERHTRQHEEDSGHEQHGGTSDHEQHGGGAEIEYPLPHVISDSEGHASSTPTLLGETSMKELFSGAPKHVNVHDVGSGNPPILTCADLKQAG
jgi:hypothetical protein